MLLGKKDLSTKQKGSQNKFTKRFQRALSVRNFSSRKLHKTISIIFRRYIIKAMEKYGSKVL